MHGENGELAGRRIEFRLRSAWRQCGSYFFAVGVHEHRDPDCRDDAGSDD